MASCTMQLLRLSLEGDCCEASYRSLDFRHQLSTLISLETLQVSVAPWFHDVMQSCSG